MEKHCNKLIDNGECIVACHSRIWIGGIGNFIKIEEAPDYIDCVKYKFDIAEFKTSALISDEGLKAKFDYVYLTDSLDSALRWCAFKLRAQGINQMAVIEVNVNEKELEEGCDHSPMMDR